MKNIDDRHSTNLIFGVIILIIIFIVSLFTSCKKEDESVVLPNKDIKLDIKIDSLDKISVLQSNQVVINYLNVKYSIKNTSKNSNDSCRYYKVNFEYCPTSGGFITYENDYNYCSLYKDSIITDSILLKIPSLQNDYFVSVVGYNCD